MPCAGLLAVDSVVSYTKKSRKLHSLVYAVSVGMVLIPRGRKLVV